MTCLNSKNHRITPFSAKQILFGTFLVIFVMITFVVARIQRLTAASAYEQIYASTQSALDFFSQFLDTSAAHLDNEFYGLLSDNLNVSMLEIESEESEIFQAKTALIRSLEKIYESSELLDQVFLYSPAGSEQEYFLYSTKLLSSSDGDLLRQYVIHACDASLNGAKFSSSNWSVHTVGAIPYLMRIASVGQTFCGGFIRLDTVLRQLDEICPSQTGSSAVFTADQKLVSGDTALSDLSTEAQNLDCLNGDQGSYILSFAKPEVLEMTMAIAVPKSGLESLKSTNLTGFIGICVILILLVLLVYICFFLMYRPFLYLSRSMQTVAQGNPNFRITRHSSVRETDKIYQTFNHMLDEMAHLKTEIYEKELEKEKVTRQFLQMQLKSHFFLNCLNIIYSLAQTKRYELIQKLAMCLVKYFRYLSTNSEELVPLREEIAHIKNYMEIQMMRFPGKIAFCCDVEESLEECNIPLLILQTFLENCVKYGLDFSKTSPVALRAVSKRKEDVDGILFTVTDCGKGFSDDLLAFYRGENHRVPSGQTHGIGILNVKNRLHLIYGGQETITIQNHLPSGAQVEIWIPKDPSFH